MLLIVLSIGYSWLTAGSSRILTRDTESGPTAYLGSYSKKTT